MYRYISHSDVPGNILVFLENVLGESIHKLTIGEVNNLLNDLEYYYEEHGQKIEYFLDE